MQRIIVVFIIISLVSLFADVVYEGGRSVSGGFLEYLGAPAIAAGILALGEFLGYAIRLPVGMFVAKKQSSRILWLTVILGYTLVLSIPVLAFAVNWRLALALYLVERLGKGLRSPSRDVVIADITDKVIGRGKAFGLHELLDQVGALIGPLAISYAIFTRNSFSYAYIILLPAALITIILILIASTLYPHVNSIKVSATSTTSTFSNKYLRMYMVFTALLSFGLIHWGLVSYHLSRENIVSQGVIPLLYALAMVVDAVVAVPLGIAYDKYKFLIVTLIPLISIPLAPLLLLTDNIVLISIAVALYGIILCSYDSILRAAVADLALAHERAIGFGWLGFIWGIFWGLGNLIGGIVYEVVGRITLAILYPIVNVVAFLYVAKNFLKYRNSKA